MRVRVGARADIRHFAPRLRSIFGDYRGSIALHAARASVECEVPARITAQQERGRRACAARLDRDRALTDLDLNALSHAFDAERGAVHRHARAADFDRERLGFWIGHHGGRERSALQLHGQKFAAFTHQCGRVRLEGPSGAAGMIDHERVIAGREACAEGELVTIQRRAAHLGGQLGRRGGLLARDDHGGHRGDGHESRRRQAQTTEPGARRVRCFRSGLAHQARFQALPIQIRRGLLAQLQDQAIERPLFGTSFHAHVDSLSVSGSALGSSRNSRATNSNAGSSRNSSSNSRRA